MAIWFAPGLTVILLSLGLTLTHIVLAIAHRPNLPLAVFAVRLRQIGIGLLFLGGGVGIALSALGQGPNILLLGFGALIAGMGGLYFIAAKAMFPHGNSMIDLSTKTPFGNKRVPIHKEEALEAKAKRLHEMVHPEDTPNSTADRKSSG